MAEITIDNKVFLIPESGSPCDLWRAYFDQLKKEVGVKNARRIWLLTWSKNGSSSCTTSAEFNRWLSKNEIDVSTAASRAIADLSQIGGNVLGLGKNITRMITIGVPVALGTVGLIVLVILLNTAKKTDATAVATLTPAGRLGKLGKAAKLL